MRNFLLAACLALTASLTGCHSASPRSATAEPAWVREEQNRSRALLGVLAKQGDVATIPRNIDFAANFPTTESRSAFMAEVKKEGFRPSPNPTWDYPNQFWCELNKTCTTQEAVIFKECRYLAERAKALGGEFDGWATTVEKK